MKYLIVMLQLFTFLSFAGEVEVSENSLQANILFQMNREDIRKITKKDYIKMGAEFAKRSDIDLQEVKQQCEKFEDREERNQTLPICELLD